MARFAPLCGRTGLAPAIRAPDAGTRNSRRNACLKIVLPSRVFAHTGQGDRIGGRDRRWRHEPHRRLTLCYGDHRFECGGHCRICAVPLESHRPQSRLSSKRADRGRTSQPWNLGLLPRNNFRSTISIQQNLTCACASRWRRPQVRRPGRGAGDGVGPPDEIHRGQGRRHRTGPAGSAGQCRGAWRQGRSQQKLWSAWWLATSSAAC